MAHQGLFNMAKMKDLELLTIVNSMEMDAVTNQDAFITKNEELLRRYRGEPYGNEVDGRSSVVSGDVRDTVQSEGRHKADGSRPIFLHTLS